MKLEHKLFELKDFAVQMAKLRNEKHFDFLVTIVGEDFGEEGLGCVYILENTKNYERISVKVVNPDRENAYIPTVSHLWKAADFLEREVFDFYGIKFLGHKDMRRLYLRSDFKGYPFRKDYDMSPENNTYTLEDDPETDYTVEYNIDENGKISANDSVIFFNFRPDRAREITRTFVDPDFKGFERKNGFFPVNFVCMTQYDATMPNVEVAFKPEVLKNTLGEYVSDKGMTQLRIAETEKYAHVTFFFNGGVEKQYPGEDRILVKSPAVATYDLQPEMSAYEVTDKLVPAIKSGKYDMIILNYANCDMVGHTGVFEAAVKAAEAVDTCVGKVVDAIKEMGGVALITADHGNADKMVAEDGSPFTAHTTNPVPFCVVNYDCELREGGRLADIAPTMLQIMGLDQPEEMDGTSLIK